LAHQTAENIEVVLIDDGSSDSSPSIAQSYCDKYDNFKLIRQKNTGLALARFTGIQAAKGEYLSFVDSDDFVDVTLYGSVMSRLLDGVDLLEFGFATFNFDNDIKYSEEFAYDSVIYDKKYFIDNVVNDTIIDGCQAVVVWNKIYKSSLVRQFVIDFGESPLEDYIFNLQYCVGVGKYIRLSEILYFYRVSSGSLSKKFNRRSYQILQNVQIIKERIMVDMGLCSLDNKLRSYRWFLRYVGNIIKIIFMQGDGTSLRCKLSDASAILIDKQLIEYCTIIVKSKHICLLSLAVFLGFSKLYVRVIAVKVGLIMFFKKTMPSIGNSK